MYIALMKRFVMDIPDELHQRLKIACVLENKTMKEVVQKLMENYVGKVEQRHPPKKT
jgi:predicted DNA-binding protein